MAVKRDRFRCALDAALDRALAESVIPAGPGRAGCAFVRVLSRNFRAPGRRLRARLLIASFLAHGGKAAPARLARWAASFELLQSFILTHDDIVDRARLRRGRNSLREEFASRGYGKADALALLGGDMYYLLGLERFLSLPIAPALMLRALRVLFATGRETVLAEVTHLLMGPGDLARQSTAAIEKIYRGKTALYSFVAPLVCGALAAGADAGRISLLARVGGALGVAYQLQDDLDDLFPGKADSGTEPFEDVRNARVTWLMVHAAHQAGRGERARLLSVYRKKNRTAKDITWIRSLVARSAAQQAAEKRIRALLKRAFGLLGRISVKARSQIENEITAAFRGRGCGAGGV